VDGGNEKKRRPAHPGWCLHHPGGGLRPPLFSLLLISPFPHVAFLECHGPGHGSPDGLAGPASQGLGGGGGARP